MLHNNNSSLFDFHRFKSKVVSIKFVREIHLRSFVFSLGNIARIAKTWKVKYKCRLCFSSLISVVRRQNVPPHLAPPRRLTVPIVHSLCISASVRTFCRWGESGTFCCLGQFVARKMPMRHWLFMHPWDILSLGQNVS